MPNATCRSTRMIQSWGQLLSFSCQSTCRYSSPNVSIHVLTDLKVNTVLGNWNCEPSLRPVHQLHMSPRKYLKHCSKLLTSPACYHPCWHRLFNSNFSISASGNQPFQKRTRRTCDHTKMSLTESANAPFSVYFPFPAIVSSRHLGETSKSFYASVTLNF